jgi:hypothetical protein
VDFLTVGDTFYFGEPIIPDGALGVNYTRQPAQWEPTNAMAYVVGPNRVYGTAPGFVKIWWYRPDGSINSPVSYYTQIPKLEKSGIAERVVGIGIDA